MPTQEALRFETIRPANRARAFTTAQVNSALSLDTIAGSKLPNYGPQELELHNNAPAATSAVVLTMQDGVSLSIVLSQNETRRVRVPIKSFVSATPATVTATAYWWTFPEKGDNAYTAILNP